MNCKQSTFAESAGPGLTGRPPLQDAPGRFREVRVLILPSNHDAQMTVVFKPVHRHQIRAQRDAASLP
jgi:hypothetical protein